MAINFYTGLMGSGKSYEVVSSVIVPAIAKGRRVITNVAGLQYHLIRDYCIESGLASDPDALGEILEITTDQLLEPGAVPVHREDGTHSPGSLIGFGDVLVVDEIWRIWGTGMRISEEHAQYLRMHRHFVNEQTGLSCDIIVISQSVTDLHKTLRVVIEMSVRTVKLKAVGRPQNYRVEIFEGNANPGRSKPSRSMLRAYKKEVFALYSSYSASAMAGKEDVVDKRQNVLRTPLLTIGLPFALVFVLGGLYGAYQVFFGGALLPDSMKEETPVEAPPSAPVPVAGAAPSGAAVPVPAGSGMRLVGMYAVGATTVAVLADSSGRITYEIATQYSDYTPLVSIQSVRFGEVSEYTGTLSAPATKQ